MGRMFTDKDMQECLELFRESWLKDDMETIHEIVSQFVADARINQVARFAVWIHRDINPVASIYFCDRLALFV